MSIQDWGAIGEILGAIGVIATLAYLARQIRSNTQATQGATINAMTRDARDLTSIIVSDRENAKIFLSGLEDLEELDDVDRMIFSHRVSHFFIFWLDVYLQSQRSLLPTDLWETFGRDIAAYMQYPGFAQVWSNVRASFPNDFQDYIDRSASVDVSLRPNFVGGKANDP